MASEMASWGKVIRDGNIKIEQGKEKGRPQAPFRLDWRRIT
jgi:hypothetical protein